MWKKLLVVLISLVGTLSLVYGMEGIMLGATKGFSLDYGSKVVIGEYNGKAMIWDVGKVNADNYLLMSTDGLGLFPVYNASLQSQCSYFAPENAYTFCPLTLLNTEIAKVALNTSESSTMIRKPFLPTIREVADGGTFNLNNQDREYKSGLPSDLNYAYWLGGYVNVHEFDNGYYQYRPWNVRMLGDKSDLSLIDRSYFFEDSATDRTPRSTRFYVNYVYDAKNAYVLKLNLRPFMMMNRANIAFAAPSSFTDGKLHAFKKNTYLPGDKVVNDPMKLRIKNDTINGDLMDIQLRDGTSISSLAESESKEVYIKANTTASENSRIAVVLYDESSNNMMYYKLLGSANNGINTYLFDIEGIPVGKYNLAILNEEYNPTTNRMVNSSAISSTMSFQIVVDHDISYSATSQGASTYEYDKNVEAGNKIGTITRSAGASSLHYEVVADGSDTSYKNFEVAGLDSQGYSSATSLDVIVKTNGAPDLVTSTNSLKAGAYKFCIVSKDVNGTPVTDILGQNKVCTSLTINKTASTISFSDVSKKSMAIGDSTYIGDLTYSNTDAVGANHILYTLSNGIAGGVLNIVADSKNPKKYNASVLSTFTATNLPTTFDVNVTIAETDNYKQATASVQKQFYIYKNLSDLIWSPIKVGSFSTSDVGANVKIGSLLATDGVEKFTYEFAKQGDAGFVAAEAVDNSDFTIVNGTGLSKGVSAEVRTMKQLTEKTYKIQFKVTDSRGEVVYKSISIIVNALNQNSVVFKTGASGTVITEYKMKFNEIDRSLFAEGGSTGATIEYYIAKASDQPGELVGSAADYADIVKIGGLITPKKVGTVNVYAKSPGNATYGDQVSSFMNLIIEQGEQSIKFANTTTSEVKVGDTTQESAIGTITLTNKTGEGGITYKSSDPSVATVDATGKVTGIAKGSVTITAILNDSNSSNTSHNPNYETVTATKMVNVYKGMSLTWTPSSTNLKAASSVENDLAGTISVVDNNGPLTYTKSSNTGVKNADASLFQLDSNNISCGVKLVGSISAADVASHSNKFYIQVDVTDSKETQTMDIEITIDNADNDVYFKEGSDKVTKITKQFGEGNNTFNFSVNTSNGVNVIYSIVTSEAQDVVTTLATGVATIQKVGTTKAQALVGAGSGYDGKTITIPVTIESGSQTVAFTNMDTLNQAFTKGGTFHDPAHLKETTANKESLRAILYSSTTPTICSIDNVGTITMLTPGNCTVTAENKDENWEETIASKTINLYLGMEASFTQTNTPQAEQANAQAGFVIGSLTVSGGQGIKTYAVSAKSDPKNIDSSFFAINSTGVISLAKSVHASDIANYYDTRKEAYIMHVQFETTDALNNKVITDAQVEVKGAVLNAFFETGDTGKITKVYSLNGTFPLNLSSNAGNGTPIYRLKNDPTMPDDVLQDVLPNGIVQIKNANDKSTNANPVMVEAIIPRSNGYAEETIEVEVEITKASQTSFGFKNKNMQMSTRSSLTPILIGKLSTGNVSLTSQNVALVDVKDNELESNTMEGSTEIIAMDAGNRNYKSAIGTATVTISSDSAYGFVIGVPSAFYGDRGLRANIKLDELDLIHPGAIGIQTWSSSHPDIASVDEDGNITVYKAGSTEITCMQKSEGDPTVSSSAILVVKPKPITINLNDKSKYVGELIPSFDISIPNGTLVGNDQLEGLPIIECLDTSGAPITRTTPAGSYSITGIYPSVANPNYNIKVTPAKLTIKQDIANASWFHLEGVTSGSTLDPTKWYNEDVNVVLDSAAEDTRTYDEISLDQSLWDASFITVNTEDENSEDVYFRIHASGILSSSQSTTIKIDKTSPAIKSITGTKINKNLTSTMLNKLTFGIFFKQGTKIRIESDDVKPTSTRKSSGVKEVAYEIYEIDRVTGIKQSIPKDKGILTPNTSGISEFVFNDIGLYRVCAIAKDYAGNSSTESCSDVNIKKIDVDIDGDDENEFQDPGNDGCPDINIPLKDEKGVIYKINVDRNEDGIPDLNIDSNGDTAGSPPDGIADINVDTDEDGKPDLNLVILTTWTPTYCVSGQKDNEGKPVEYCTMKDIEALINVDTGKDNTGGPPDGIPDINIDTTGDMKADLNIIKDGSKNMYSNITTIKTWKPDKDLVSGVFAYDTDIVHKPHLNIDSDENGRPDMNIDIDNDGIGDINIDVNGDGKPDVNIDSDGDGKEDFNIDKDDDGIADENIIVIPEWKPDKPIKDTDFETMGGLKANDTLVDENSGIQIQKPGGSFLPNYSIKVNDIKDHIDVKDKGKIDGYIDKDTEIKDIYDVELSDGTTTIQPEGSIKVRIPVSEELVNSNIVKVIVEQADGSYIEVSVTIKDGYIEYETDYLGKVGIIADKVIDDKVQEPERPDVPIPDFKPNGSGGSTPEANVKNDYISGISGAGTGDYKNIIFMAFLCGSSIMSMGYVFYKKKEQ